MAKPPSQRRGITASPRADRPASRERLSVQPEVSDSLIPEDTPSGAQTAGGSLGVTPQTLLEQLAQCQKMSADADVRWRRQAEALQRQLRHLEQDREDMARQTRELQAWRQTRQTSGRLGVLLALLALAGVAALGIHTWPRLQGMALDLSRASAGVAKLAELAPQVQAVRGQVASMTADLAQMGSTMASLREDVSGVRSDLGSLRQGVHASADNSGAVRADAGGKRGPAIGLPRNATTMSNPYRGMRPMMPW